MKQEPDSSIQLLGLLLDALTADSTPGDFFVADFQSNAVYKVNPDGTRSLAATGLIQPSDPAPHRPVEERCLKIR